jgi:hypothetical protein
VSYDLQFQAPATQPALTRDQLHAVAQELAKAVSGEVRAIDGGWSVVAERAGFHIDLAPSGGAYAGSAQALDGAWAALDALCDRTGWSVFDPQLGRTVLGMVESNRPPTTSEPAWPERALRELERRKLVIVRKVNRAAVIDVLAACEDEPARAIQQLEDSPAVDEVFGDEAELLDALRAASAPRQ